MVKEGYIEKVIYKNDDNGYAVFTVSGEDGEDVFVGTLHDINEGMYIEAEGEYVEHPQYDLQFKFTSYKIKMPDDALSVEKYLGSGIIKGVGPALAKRIVKKFKMDSLRIIEEEPERLAEIKGISARMARNIAVSYSEKKEMQDAIIFLTGYAISVNLAVKIYNEYGSDLYDVVRTNPYKIAEDITGVGFKTADEIAMRMGIQEDSDFRIRAAVLYTLTAVTGLGHMYLPQEMLVKRTYSLLTDEMTPYSEDLVEHINRQIVFLQIDGKIVVKQIHLQETDGEDTVISAVYSSANYYMELNTARMLTDLDVDFSFMGSDVMDNLKLIQEQEHISLDGKQVEAIESAVTHGVSIVTGGPGTGKTTTINALIKVFEMSQVNIMLGAPTGRAAKRITEASGYTAQTIHRMLELTGGSTDEEGFSAYQFGRNASNPLETDVIIIDEMSMVDNMIFYNLLKAIMPGTRLVLVGDANQLPSVGPGNVLRDIIASGTFAVTELDKIFRQGEGSDIITNAHKINKGISLEIKNTSKDFFYIPRSNTRSITDELEVLITKNLPKFFKLDPMNIQILTPMRKSELGVENLNKKLQDILNPKRVSLPEKERDGVIFRQGDKVMQIKNNYKLEWKIKNGSYVKEEGVGVFNGDVGFITGINDFDQIVTVEFDDCREVQYTYGQLDELEHAYAITIHKSQGSEYPVVIIPLFYGPPKLLSRNLLYTAVSRAKQGVVLVGNLGMVDTMIKNNLEQKRYTTLALRLKEIRDGGIE